jgi:hypothetical protein
MMEANDLLELQQGFGGAQIVVGHFQPAARRKRHEYWTRLLYEHDVPEWFINHAQVALDFEMPRLLRSLKSGDFFYNPSRSYEVSIIDGYALPREEAIQLGGKMLGKIAAILVCLKNPEALRHSLERDGYTVDCNNMQLISLEGPVKIQEEEDRFRKLIRAVTLPHEMEILKHLTDATDLYSDAGKEHSCINECRSFVQSLIDDISEETDRLGGHSVRLPGGTGNRFQYLQNVGFLNVDEFTAVGSAWGTLSAGSHPGVPPRDAARIGLVLAIEFGQLLVLKFTAWVAKGLKSF